MPGNAMSAREVWQVVAYVRSLGRLTREPLPGNAARGAEVYRDAGVCRVSHGGRQGRPDGSRPD